MGEPREGAEPGAAAPSSFGNMSEHHWSRARRDKNAEAMAYLRERSQAPGVAEGGAERNHYCMQCQGVIPLQYDQRSPADELPGNCPHCGAELDARVRAMFNWVEIDQPPRGDAKLALGLAAALLLLLAGAAWLLWRLW